MLCNKNNLPLDEASYNKIRDHNCSVLLIMRGSGADDDTNRHKYANKGSDLKSIIGNE